MNHRHLAIPHSGVAVIAFLVLFAGLLGCRSTHPVPEGEVSSARSAIAAAEDAGASEHAPVEIRRARQKLEQSQAAMDRRDNLQARILAKQAEVDARLAELTARAVREEQSAESLRASLDALREEIARHQRVIRENQ